MLEYISITAFLNFVLNIWIVLHTWNTNSRYICLFEFLYSTLDQNERLQEPGVFDMCISGGMRKL